MSRGPTKPGTQIIEQPQGRGEACTRCGTPWKLHRAVTVHVCYSDRVIKHLMCPPPDERPAP